MAMQETLTDIHDNRHLDDEQDEPELQEYDTRRFHFINAYDLCLEPSPINWLIKDYLEAGSFSMTFGEAGTMKSFLSIDMGLCIAAGKDWHGIEVRQKGPVFYIAGEGFAGISRRIKAWADYKGVDLEGIPFFVSDRAAQFLDDDSVQEVSKAVEELAERNGNPVLVIVDTLNRNFGPGDEGHTKDMTEFILAIDKALRLRFKCAVSIIHHNGWSDKSRPRGAYALRAALDWEYQLIKNVNGILTLKNTKVKEHEIPPTMYFKWKVVTLDGWIDPDTGETLTSCILHKVEEGPVEGEPLKENAKILFNTLVTLGKATIKEWRKEAYLVVITKADSKSDAKRKAFDRAKEELQKAGRIKEKDGYFLPVCQADDMDKSGHLPDMSGDSIPDGQDTPL